jgi:hypothetical protein
VHAERRPPRPGAPGWQHLAETYRWLGYQQAAFGKWQPPVVSEVGDAAG